MLKTIIVLPDGTELSSGVGTHNAVRSMTLTECVNDAFDLSLGSACANMLELELITPAGGLRIEAGQEIQVYREDAAGVRHKVGLFTAEKPTRTSANTLSVTAYDRVSWLDRDLTDWLGALTGWPYRLYDLAVLVCAQCGLTLANASIPNGDFPVCAFSAQGITGRDLIRWIGQLAGRFCRATAEGTLEFAWYRALDSVRIGPRRAWAMYVEGQNLILYGDPVTAGYALNTLHLEAEPVQATCSGTDLTLELQTEDVRWYFGGSLTFADYQVAPVEKVRLRLNQSDVGAIFPDDAAARNTYCVTGNYLLTGADPALTEPVAQSLYEQLSTLTYTPCKVSIPACTDIHAGDILPITDQNGRTVVAYIMKKTQSGQRDTLECTGNIRRDSSASVNDRSFRALSGRVLELRMDVEGLKAENRDAAGNAASLALTVDGISAQVQHQQTRLEEAGTQLTQLQQDAQGLALEITRIQTDGVSQVQTTTGYTFGAQGLRIQKSGEEMENRLDNTGMYVTRAGEAILRANNQGVLATDVTVRNYLVVGSHARLEDYNNGTDAQRTACFFV